MAPNPDTRIDAVVAWADPLPSMRRVDDDREEQLDREFIRQAKADFLLRRED